MTFTSNMPVITQSLGTTQPLVLGNFASLRTTISNTMQPNHIDVNDTGAGKHIFVQMPVKTPSAANLPGVNEGGLITQTKSGKSELFYVRDNVATYTQMTTGDPVVAQTGQSYLPGGILLKWAHVAAVTNGATVSFATPFPNACFGVMVTLDIASTVSPVATNGYSTTGFVFKTTAVAGVPIFYLAIGN